jgi:hypothetical protein
MIETAAHGEFFYGKKTETAITGRGEAAPTGA